MAEGLIAVGVLALSGAFIFVVGGPVGIVVGIFLACLGGFVVYVDSMGPGV